jgi:hypothetical protein
MRVNFMGFGFLPSLLTPPGDRRFMSSGRTIVNAIVIAGLTTPTLGLRPAQAQFAPYCQQTLEAITEKETLRQALQKGDKDAEKRYRDRVADHARQIQACRKQNNFRSQGIWLRLYECDARPGRLEEVLDRIVERGYSEVFVETFFNGMVLLPKSDNPTQWQSALDSPSLDKRDLLAEIIQKGRDRGLKVHAWMFAMNFGYNYAIRPEKQPLLIRNGRGQTSIETENSPGLSTELGSVNPNEAFIDPYNPIARRDYLQMLQEVLKRKPDGMYFDYIRYPRLKGKRSMMSQVEDLWVYSDASKSAMLARAQNSKGRELIQRYVDNKQITARDLEDLDRLYPQEAAQPPLWQGRNPAPNENQLTISSRQAQLNDELWRFAVAHTYQGVVDFLTMSVAPAQQQGIRTGAVFFSDANQVSNNRYDSRLQPWDRFPANVEFHPMAYANCNRVDCITDQIQRVLKLAPYGTKVYPVLAGIWQQSVSNRPPLEVQMQGMQQIAPQIDGLSHFAFSWQEPLSDRDRKFCRAPLPIKRR